MKATRFNAPKQQQNPETSLETELDAVTNSEDVAFGTDAVPDSDPNRPQ